MPTCAVFSKQFWHIALEYFLTEIAQCAGVCVYYEKKSKSEPEVD